MISRRYSKIVCTLMLCLFLTGCWDYRDINRRTITISIGADVLNDNIVNVGEKAKLSSSSLEKGNTNQMIETYKFQGKGKNFDEVRSSFDAKTPNPEFPGSTRVFVFSKRYAEERGIEPYMKRLYYLIGLRSSIMLAVSKESVDELYSKKVKNDISTGYAIEDTIRYLDLNGSALYKTVQNIESDMEFGSIGFLLPYVTEEDDTIEYLGFAAFNGNKLVGTVKREEGKGFLFVLSKKVTDVRSINHLKNPKTLISIKSNLAKRSIKTSYKDNKINIYINLKLKSQMQYEENVEPINKQDMEEVKKIIENKIKEDILSSVIRSQKEFKSDVFGFARYFKGENIKIYRQINWKEEYPKAIFHVNVDTNIVNTNFLDPNAKGK
ncbi:spore gernimation protein GerC [Clostridium carboxidivorans P7]|uniref:Germination protein, Ger(X)C family n=1 Tax=Clostridium carboxidivorans P7 TaxID=536227 RepID=C6PZ13_9CLOT|nr:Ger(x)C family spore germination protein [Clostridium carboxidivorans]AKN31410.1 spore gernimation protein GerC [Clostridium carboxidivorans P7]EET85499.1 germination protein, Ger(x)C family [Clostridium carboxidivorans P7]EFG87199.1 germination protein, Ger(X)C family [Clostridium carboxidivorans P7]